MERLATLWKKNAWKRSEFSFGGVAKGESPSRKGAIREPYPQCRKARADAGLVANHLFHSDVSQRYSNHVSCEWYQPQDDEEQAECTVSEVLWLGRKLCNLTHKDLLQARQGEARWNYWSNEVTTSLEQLFWTGPKANQSRLSQGMTPEDTSIASLKTNFQMQKKPMFTLQS